jgi:hypothetical protein
LEALQKQGPSLQPFAFEPLALQRFLPALSGWLPVQVQQFELIPYYAGQKTELPLPLVEVFLLHSEQSPGEKPKGHPIVRQLER